MDNFVIEYAELLVVDSKRLCDVVLS